MPLVFFSLSLIFSLHVECCCKSNKTPFLTTLDSANVSTITGNGNNTSYNAQTTDSIFPPNYDELDPPPSYSTLFPGSKDETAQSIEDDVNEPSSSSTQTSAQRMTNATTALTSTTTDTTVTINATTTTTTSITSTSPTTPAIASRQYTN